MNVPPVDAAAVKHAADVLRNGGLVALPTETVYGLAADADNEAAVRALFAAKGRPADHPVIVHIDGAALDDWAADVPESARVLVRAFWPGPLTLVLKRTARATDTVTGAQDTVGLRSPSHPWTRAVLREFGGALAAPSANSFGRVSPTTAQHVIDDLGVKPRGRIDLVLDAGACPVGIESTIVDLSGRAAPAVLRPGSITREQLQRALGCPLADAGTDAPRASGRLEKHYAPRTPLRLMNAEELAHRLMQPSGARIAVLAPLSLLENCRAEVALAIAAPDDPDDYARALYSSLHRLDTCGAHLLLIAAPSAGPRWEAIRDRLRRAEAGAAET